MRYGQFSAYADVSDLALIPSAGLVLGMVGRRTVVLP